MDRARLVGLFNELEKLSGVVDAVLKNVATNPVKYYAAKRRMEKGKESHRQMMEAVEHPYPASWVALGMMPKSAETNGVPK